MNQFESAQATKNHISYEFELVGEAVVVGMVDMAGDEVAGVLTPVEEVEAGALDESNIGM